MRRHTHILVVLAGLVAIGIVLLMPTVGRGSPPAAHPVQVVVSGWASSDQETTLLSGVIGEFEKTHPSITVDYQPLSGDYRAEMEARFAAGNPPDVSYVSADAAKDWIANGYLLPLRGLATANGFDTSHFFPVLLRAFEGDGGQPFGFPKDWSPLAIYTNDNLLEEAGVNAPTTWAELRAVAEQLKTKTSVTPICISADWARLLAFVEENGGSFLNDSWTAATINSQAARDAVAFYVGLVQDGLAALPSSLGASWCGEAFADGKAAITFEGNWLRPVLDAAVAPLDYSIHSMLAGAQRANLAFTTAYSIAAASQHKQAAWELLSYLTGHDGMQLWAAGGLALPSRDDVTPAAGSEAFLGEVPYSTVWDFPRGFASVLTLANDELAAVFAGDETIDGMLTTLQSAANAALTS